MDLVCVKRRLPVYNSGYVPKTSFSFIQVVSIEDRKIFGNSREKSSFLRFLENIYTILIQLELKSLPNGEIDEQYFKFMKDLI